jgi:HPt (histidine-containing phosphotransfer) domain-containing protein
MAGAADRATAGENRQPPPTGLALLVCAGAPEANAAIARLLEPFGNKLAIAESLAEAIERGARQNFDAIIVGASDADMLAAAPGVHAPLVAILMRGDRAPAATDTVLRWPLEADPFYRALEGVCVKPGSDADDAAALSPAIDAAAIAAVEQSVGGTRALVEILQCYIVTAEDLMTGLSKACQDDKWDEAARLAQDIVGSAGGLGLAAMTQAARRFARSAREGEDRHGLRNAAQGLWSEHLRAKRALAHLYPDVAA